MDQQDQTTATTNERSFPADQPRGRRSKKTSKRSRVLPLIFVAVLVLVAGLFIAALNGMGATTSLVPAPTLQQQFSTKDPVVRDDSPTPTGLGANKLSIPSIGLQVDLVPSDSNGKTIELPSSEKAGIYTGTSPLGAKTGNTLIAGHVNFKDGSLAPMSKITKITNGAKVFVTDNSGRIYSFAVTSAHDYPKQALPPFVYQTTGERSLTVATCTGQIGLVEGETTFLDNILITAKPTSAGASQHG